MMAWKTKFQSMWKLWYLFMEKWMRILWRMLENKVHWNSNCFNFSFLFQIFGLGLIFILIYLKKFILDLNFNFDFFFKLQFQSSYQIFFSIYVIIVFFATIWFLIVIVSFNSLSNNCHWDWNQNKFNPTWYHFLFPFFISISNLEFNSFLQF